MAKIMLITKTKNSSQTRISWERYDLLTTYSQGVNNVFNEIRTNIL